jgi:hypothetical protein
LHLKQQLLSVDFEGLPTSYREHKKHCAKLHSAFLTGTLNYLRVTTPPTSSSLALRSLASSSETPSLITEGTLSTRPLASFKPRPVISRTALIALTFWSPDSVNSTSYESLVAPASAPPAATATGAAAETSNSSSIALTRSFKSEIDASF